MRVGAPSDEDLLVTVYLNMFSNLHFRLITRIYFGLDGEEWEVGVNFFVAESENAKKNLYI